MGDAENAPPPSKKRAAGRELTRDTPIDDEEDVGELETGTFKRANDEVLATRRIVKVRRQQTSSAPSSNPFAGIRLVAPTESSANPAEATIEVQSTGENTIADDSKGSDDIAQVSVKAKDGETKQSENKTDEVVDKPIANNESAEESNADGKHIAENESTGDKSEVDKDQIKDVNESENEDKKDAARESASEGDKGQTKNDNASENDDKKEETDYGDKKDNKVESAEPSAEGGHLKSFQMLSSSQNAFIGLAGTGFSTSSFSFVSTSNDGSGSIFGTKNDKPFGLGLSNNGSSVFGASGASAVSKSEGSGFAAMQEVVVETGEENERVIFNSDSVLFEFVDGSWKERGKGELRVNVTSGTEKARLLMRSKGNLRLILNARVYPDMKLTNMEKKGVTFACMNSAAEGKGGLSTFALKFKDGSIVEEFKAAVMAHKGETSTVIKTPENSPKASDD
ncbi:nuclear pore complex protein NUP50A-like [Gastrolobium bilobum]|uniref:nuclear pore complex protein NUP50A-like n=1 Tax=Gastrolobium bilobum TaxID=150636 RepID=UPI002AB09B44|nr:nuclear pore complex protein NUP50A-like [Gastrolobium bilobum]XP_061338544.1 nuclear pore complex protein NUP50A-like [Gastrolobium bilobum]